MTLLIVFVMAIEPCLLIASRLSQQSHVVFREKKAPGEMLFTEENVDQPLPSS